MPLNSLIPAFSIPSTLPLVVSAVKKIWPAGAVARPAGGGAEGGAWASAGAVTAAPSAPAARLAAAMTPRRLM
jgi:hypothetical protein